MIRPTKKADSANSIFECSAFESAALETERETERQREHILNIVRNLSEIVNHSNGSQNCVRAHYGASAVLTNFLQKSTGHFSN